MTRQETEQESFWKADFGIAYASRNVQLSEHRRPFFSRLLEQTGPINSACELGANIGENLKSLRQVQPGLELYATEINPVAFARLQELGFVMAENKAIQDYEPSRNFELVFTCGVLIHLNPGDLEETYRKMVRLSSRYILVNEYFNPTPTQISYRGHDNKLFKRDFAGELLDLHQDQLEVIDYGFLWRRMEPGWDDTTWTLFQKKL